VLDLGCGFGVSLLGIASEVDQRSTSGVRGGPQTAAATGPAAGAAPAPELFQGAAAAEGMAASSSPTFAAAASAVAATKLSQGAAFTQSGGEELAATAATGTAATCAHAIERFLGTLPVSVGCDLNGGAIAYAGVRTFYSSSINTSPIAAPVGGVGAWRLYSDGTNEKKYYFIRKKNE